MQYTVELYDTFRRRIAVLDQVPRLELRRRGPDQPDEVRGLLPAALAGIGPGYRLRVLTGNAVIVDTTVTRAAPAWGDLRRLILDRYVNFHEVLEVHATAQDKGNSPVARAYTNREIGGILRDLINAAPGPVHYLVDHAAYPDGAQREQAKFDARQFPENELEPGGIGGGDWITPPRLDAGAAFAKDGDTIAGLVVDGEPWPDLRLMMIDCEESALNSHAIARHPEVAFWTSAEYDASMYRQRADAATAALQSLIATNGIHAIELNPHKDASGAYDDRVDAYGRYLGLVFGGGQCFNAAMVELGHADVYLYDDGRYLAPELALKDFFSYAGAQAASIGTTGVSLAALDVRAGVFEAAAALAYAAGGWVFDVDPERAVHFHRQEMPERVLYFDPRKNAFTFSAAGDTVRNLLHLQGNPFTTELSKTYARNDSIAAYGLAPRTFAWFSISQEADADLFAAGLLDDLAYPEPDGSIVVFRGDPAARVGELVEVRGPALRRHQPELAAEWQGRFAGRLVGRVREVRHLFSGRDVTTTLILTSPLRSVSDPLAFILRSQEPASALFEFRLDDSGVGLDLGYHLD